MTRKHPSGEEFRGVIGRTAAESKPWWPDAVCPTGKPNVVIVVLDDTGFAHFGCYGSTIETPNVDRLAQAGLQFTGFHTTALCSPSRASLLTGRNHHAVQMRSVSNFDTGFPHMRGAVPPSAGTLAEILRGAGYATFAAGKWHLAPLSECTVAGPYRNWPLQKGFDRYYGFLQGETDQFRPELTADNTFIDPPAGPEDGYHLSEDLVDRAMGFIRDQKSLVPERPFFLYLAFAATHAPHQAPKAYLEKYRGRFDAGWDVARAEWFANQRERAIVPEGTQLAPHNPGVRPWAELSGDERRFAARLQEAFSAMLDHTDAQIGRLTAFLDEMGLLEDTILLVLSDNGASKEGGATGLMDEMRFLNGLPEDLPAALSRLDQVGGPKSFCNYPWGWAQAGNTPLKWYKSHTHGGGVRDPFVMHWPKGIARTGLRHQFCHLVDIVPTLLDCVGVEAPRELAGVPQMPLHGRSLKPLIAEPDASLGDRVQYFEMFGNRGIYAEGWKAVTLHRPGSSYDEEAWELYRLDTDFSECRDLAAEEPARLEKMVALWWREAEAHGVLPLDDRVNPSVFRSVPRGGLPAGRLQYVYYPPVTRINNDACPWLARGWTIRIEIEHPAGAADGALLARGTVSSGFALYVKDGRVVHDYSFFQNHVRSEAPEPLSPGRHEIEVDVTRTADKGGDIALRIDGKDVGHGRIPRLPWMISQVGMDIGRSLAPMNDDYEAPFVYPGRIRRVVIDIPESSDPADRELQAEAGFRAAMASQ
ncbi:MAG: arylsulfatase [Alphaproteobacteria bacterium]|nr:arylsulfatase [Alphaproteobacteria bacterium]